MFERIIVPQELIELRERACQGEFDALYELAIHVMGVNPVLHSYTEIFALITAILEHAQFRESHLASLWMNVDFFLRSDLGSVRA